MPETLNSVNIGIVTIGFNSVFQKSQDLFNKESNILVRQNPILKNQFYSLKKAKEQKYTDYKINTEKQKTISITETQKIQEEMNVRKVNTINTYKDAHSPADLSRLIDKQNDEGMKALE